MWEKADSRLKTDTSKMLLVSGVIYENYRKYLQSNTFQYTPSTMMEGFQSLMWNGIPVINMEVFWDRYLEAHFEGKSDHSVYYLPNRALLTVPSNIPIGTLNSGDFTTLESWYEKKERQNYSAYGYTLDAKLLENYMMVKAY